MSNYPDNVTQNDIEKEMAENPISKADERVITDFWRNVAYNMKAAQSACDSLEDSVELITRMLGTELFKIAIDEGLPFDSEKLEGLRNAQYDICELISTIKDVREDIDKIKMRWEKCR